MNAIEWAISYYVTIDEGIFVELGVATGGSLRQIIYTYTRRKIFRNNGEIGAPRVDGIYGFDSFCGLPDDWKPDFPKGAFDMGGEPPQIHGATIIAGMFEDTLPEFCKSLKAENKTVSLLHVDCDLYDSAFCGLTTLNPFIKTGTIIVFDEFYNHGGAEVHEQLALKDWQKIYNREVIELPNGDSTVNGKFRATFEVVR